MDKMHVVLKYAKKYQDWIVAALVLVIGLASWYLATSRVSKETVANKKKIDDYFKKARALQSKPNHPNPTFHTAVEDIIKYRREKILKAWEVIWQRQGEHDFAWPQGLTQRFRDHVKDLRPIETEGMNPANEFPDVGRNEEYRSYIGRELPKLAEIVQASWKVDPAELGSEARPSVGGSRFGGVTRGEGGRGSLQAEEDDAIVFWDPEDQKQIVLTHFHWPERAPKLFEILYAHEDYKILEALLNVIAQTNGPVAARHNAVITDIRSLKIGKRVLQDGTGGRFGAIALPEQGAGTGPGGLGEGGGLQGAPTPAPLSTPGSNAGGVMQPGGEGVPGVEGEGGGLGESEASALQNRYVDKNYLPLPASKLKEIAEQQSAPDDIYLAIAKRMPVLIHLVMDERKIPELLINCANYSIPIEVRQVRVSQDPARAGQLALDFASEGSSGSSGYRDGGRNFSPSGGNTSSSVSATHDYKVHVQIYGIVYIYNPVNEKLIWKEGTPGAAPEGGRPKNDTPAPAIDPTTTTAGNTGQPGDAASNAQTAAAATTPAAGNGSTDNGAAVNGAAAQDPPAAAGQNPAPAAKAGAPAAPAKGGPANSTGGDAPAAAAPPPPAAGS